MKLDRLQASCCVQEHGVASSREEMQEMFAAMDKDGSGQLNIREFGASQRAVSLASQPTQQQSPGQRR